MSGGLDEHFVKDIVNSFVPAILEDAYERGYITENAELDELIEIVKKYKANDIDSFALVLVISGHFKAAIHDEISKGRSDVAISLAGVYIEQITNEFYQNVLIYKHDFSNVRFNDCMKSVSVEGKLTWLFKLSTNTDINDELVGKIKKIYSARNKYAHYKPKIEIIKEISVDENNDKSNQDISIETLIPTINELEDVYNDIINKLFPSKAIGQKLFEKFKEIEK